LLCHDSFLECQIGKKAGIETPCQIGNWIGGAERGIRRVARGKRVSRARALSKARASKPRAFTADAARAEAYPSGRPTQFAKTQRAFSTYIALVDTAEWMRWQMRGQLEMYGLSMAGFRLLEMLCREGATSIVEAASKRECSRHNMEEIVASLEKREFVRRKVLTRAPAEVRETKLAKAKRGQRREGRRVWMVELTRAGRKLLKVVLPGHAKVVKALMRVLDGREQDTLRKLCEKLREEDIMKYMQEMAYED